MKLTHRIKNFLREIFSPRITYYHSTKPSKEMEEAFKLMDEAFEKMDEAIKEVWGKK